MKGQKFSGGMAWNSSRYLRAFYDAAPKGAPAGGTAVLTPDEIEKVTTHIRSKVAEEMATRNYITSDQLTALINKQLEGLPVEQLRAFDPAKLDQTVTNIAGELEMLKHRGMGANKPAVSAFLRDMEAKWNDIEALHKAAQKGQEITIGQRVAVPMTTGNVITVGAAGALPDDAIESISLEAFIRKRYGAEYIDQIANVVTETDIEEYSYWYEEGSIEGAFAIVAEGGLKPLLSATVVRNWAKAQKAAGKYVITEELAKFRARILEIIDRMMRDQLERDYSSIITAAMVTAAVPYAGTPLDGTITAPNDYDAIGAAAAQAMGLRFRPNVIALNQFDLWRIRLTKDADNNYIFPVVMQEGTTNIVGLQVVVSDLVPQGTFYLAERGLFQVRRENITARMGYGITTTSSGGNITSVEHDFDYNRMRFILEMFFKTWLPTAYSGSIIAGDFDTIKTALAVA